MFVPDYSEIAPNLTECCFDINKVVHENGLPV